VIDEIINGYQLDATGKLVNYTYHHDALQSVLGQSGHEGSILAKQTYSSFGSILSQTGLSNNTQKYTGREIDKETGLYNYRNRIYDPITGRFISSDPVTFAAGVNFYTYCLNNPVNCNDPSGFRPGIDSYPTMDLAAAVALYEANPQSITQKAEYSGSIYQVNGEQGYRYTNPEQGEDTSSRFVFPPSGSTLMGLYHTHGNYINGLFDKYGVDRNTHFSIEDKNGNSGGDIPFAESLGKSSYMMDPFYKLHKYDPNSSLKTKLGRTGQILTPKSIFNQIAPQSSNSSGSIGVVDTTMISAINSSMGLINPGNGLGSGLGTLSVDLMGFGNAASGGYVLYPSKPNNNMVQSVYRK
jgi:RHS repeat-associated protein